MTRSQGRQGARSACAAKSTRGRGRGVGRREFIKLVGGIAARAFGASTFSWPLAALTGDQVQTYEKITQAATSATDKLKSAVSDTGDWLSSAGFSKLVNQINSGAGDLASKLSGIAKTASLLSGWGAVILGAAELVGAFKGSDEADQIVSQIRGLFVQVMNEIAQLDQHQEELKVVDLQAQSKSGISEIKTAIQQGTMTQDGLGTLKAQALNNVLIPLKTLTDGAEPGMAGNLTADNINSITSNPYFTTLYVSATNFNQAQVRVHPSPEPQEGRLVYEYRQALPALMTVCTNFILYLLMLEPNFRQIPEHLDTLRTCRAALEAHYWKINGSIVTMPYTGTGEVFDLQPGTLLPVWLGAVEPFSGSYQVRAFSELLAAPVPPRLRTGSSTWTVETARRRKRLCQNLGLDNIRKCVRSLATIAGEDAWTSVDPLTSWSVRWDVAFLVSIGDLTPPQNGFSDGNGHFRIGAILRALIAPGNFPHFSGGHLSVRQVLSTDLGLTVGRQ